MLHTRNNSNNTDGNKLVIFSGTASCYKVILIHVEALLLILCTSNKLMIFSHIWQSQVEIKGMQQNNVRFLPGTATYSTDTLFLPSDATATIIFAAHFCLVTMRGQ